MSIELRAQAAAVCAPYRPWQPVAPQGDDQPAEERTTLSADEDPRHGHRPDGALPSRAAGEGLDGAPAATEAETRPMNGVPAGTERLVSAPPGGLPVFETLVAESRPGLFDQPPLPSPPDVRPAPRHA